MNCNAGFDYPEFMGGTVYNLISPSNADTPSTATSTISTATITTTPAPSNLKFFSQVWSGYTLYGASPINNTIISYSSMTLYFDECAAICLG